MTRGTPVAIPAARRAPPTAFSLMGELAIFPEDVVLGTCVRDRVTLVIRVESIGSDEPARSKVQRSPFFRRATDKAPTV